MADEIVLPFDERLRHRWVAFHSKGAGEDRRRNLVLVEEFDEAPDADATAELEERFQRELAATRLDRVRAFTRAFDLRVPIEHVSLRSLFIVDNDVDSETRSVRPLEFGPPISIANEVTGHIHRITSTGGGKTWGLGRRVRPLYTEITPRRGRKSASLLSVKTELLRRRSKAPAPATANRWRTSPPSRQASQRRARLRMRQ